MDWWDFLAQQPEDGGGVLDAAAFAAQLDLDTTAKSSNMANFDPAFDKMIRNEGGFKITHIEKE